MPVPTSSSKPLPRILVLGASGFIGSNLVPALLRQGYRVRAGGRAQEALQRRNWPGVECLEVDVLRPETLPGALEDMDVIYYLVHGMTEGSGFSDREQQGARHLAEAARDAGISRIIYMGALQPKDAHSMHLASRKATGDILRSSGVAVTEIRAPIVVGPGSAAFEVMRDLVYNLPLMTTPRWVRSKMAPIALDNLLYYMVELLNVPGSDNATFDVAGPEMISYEAQMRTFAQLIGKQRWIVPIPFLTPRLSAYWLGLITSVPTGIARALVGGMKQDLPAEDGPIRALLPQTLLPFKQAAEQALAEEEDHLAAGHLTVAPALLKRWRPNYGFYAKRAGARGIIQAPADAIWQELTQIGGKHRYFAMDWLWTIREWMDGLVGGAGRNHYRRHPTELELGDRVDSWQVIEFEPQRRLTLLFGMKAPGAGGLTFRLLPVDEGSTELVITAWWHPAGIWGLLYWFAMMPPHLLIFRRMLTSIEALVERPPRTRQAASGQ